MQKDKTIKEELKSVSALIHGLHETDALKNMEPGFINSEESLMNAVNQFNYISVAEDLLTTQVNLLPNSLEVPQGYFAETPDLIIDRIRKEKNTGIIFSLKSYWKFAAAASVVPFLGVGILKYYQSYKTFDAVTCMEVSCRIAQLPEPELIGYLQENGTDVDAAVVASLVDDDLPPEDELWMNDQPVKDVLINAQTN